MFYCDDETEDEVEEAEAEEESKAEVSRLQQDLIELVAAVGRHVLHQALEVIVVVAR